MAKKIKIFIKKMTPRYNASNSWCWRMTGDCSFHVSPIDGFVDDVHVTEK